MSDFKIVSVLNPAPQYINVSGIIDVSLSGNTDGVLANVSTGTLILAGGNNITLSQDGQSVSIIGGAGGGGGGGIALAAGTQTATTNTIVFSNSNGITFGMSGSTRVTASYTVPSVAGLLSAINVSACTTSNNLSALTFSNGNGVTFGLDGSTITASVAAAGGAQTGISGIIASDATYTSGTVSFSNQNGVTIGSSVNGATQYIRLSVATNYQSQGAYLTTAMASGASTQFVQANAGFNGTNASGTIASNSISVSVAAPIPIGTAVKAVASVGSTGTITRYAPEDHQHAGVAAFAVTNTGNTLGNTRSQVGTLFIAASGGITASQSTAAAGNDTIWLSVAAPVAQTAQTGISGIIVSDATYTSGTVSFSNAGNITISSSVNGATQYIRLSGNAAQTNQSAIKGFGASNTGNTAGNTGISTGIDWVLAGSTNITVSQSTAVGGPNTLWLSVPNVAAGAVTFSAGAASAGLGSVVFSNSNGVSFGLNGSTITASAAGGGGGIGGGVSTGGNTAGSTGTVTTGNIIFVGSNAISLSQSTGAAGSAATITINAPATSSMIGTGGIALSSNGSTISVSLQSIPHYEPIPLLNPLSTTWAPTSSSWYFQPFILPFPMSGGRINVMVAHGSTASILKESTSNFQTNSTGTLSVNFTYARNAALYSVGAGTNSTRLESFWSNQWSLSIDQLIKVASAAGPNMTVSVGATMSMMSSLDSAGGVTTSTMGHSSTSAGAVSSIGSAAMSTILTSERNVLSSQLMIPIPFNTTVNAGLYYLAQMWITASTTATTGGVTTAPVLSIVNQYGVLGNTNTAARIWGQTAATSGSAPFMGVGVYSAGSASPPATVAFSDLRSYASMQLNYFNIQNSSI